MNTGIGGLVYKKAPQKINNWLNDHKTFVNARSAIKYLFDYLKPKEIWLPSYLCQTIIQGNHNFKFYDCDIFENLSKYFDLANKKNNIFYYIEYFGFAKNIDFKDKKCIVIQDCSQSIFLKKNPQADYAVYSFTKMLPVPDGGSFIGDLDPNYENNNAHVLESFKISKKAIELRRNGNENWRDFYLRSKKKPIGFYQMSDYSKKIIHNIDLEQIAKNFKNNYNAVSSKINSLFKISDNIPVGFPVLLKKRDFILKTLIEKKIYPAIHWKLPFYFKKSSNIEKKILTIPCAWCSSEEIDYLCEKIKIINKYQYEHFIDIT